MQNPPVLLTMPGTTETSFVPQNLWKYYSTDGQARQLLAIVKGVVLNAALTKDPYSYIGGASILDPNVAMWRIEGTYNGAPVNEWCGDLFDRMSSPNVWVDKNPDSSVGGSQIHVTQYGSDYTELSWRKAGSQPA